MALLESRNVAFGFLATETDLQEELTFIDTLQRIKLSISIVTSRFIVQATAGLHNYRSCVEATFKFWAQGK